jgi:hypothetical protein
MVVGHKLAFGVEIEAVLLFHETRRCPHNEPNTLQDLKNQDSRPGTKSAEEVVKDLLKRHVIPNQKLHGFRTTQVHSWLIKSDLTMKAFSEDDLGAFVHSGKKNEQKVERWHSDGVEFLSPPFTIADHVNTLSQVGKLLVLPDTSTSDVPVNKSCGLHVHVGLQDNALFPLDVLQI